MVNKEIEEIIDSFIDDTGVGNVSGTMWNEDRKLMVKSLTTLINKCEQEAITKYRIDFERGVQNVVENTVAKDRVREIQEDAVREFVEYIGFVAEKPTTEEVVQSYLLEKGSK